MVKQPDQVSHMIVLSGLFPPGKFWDPSCVTASPTLSECTQAAGPPSLPPTHIRRTTNQSNLGAISLLHQRDYKVTVAVDTLKAGVLSKSSEEILKQLHLSPLSPAMGTRAGGGRKPIFQQRRGGGTPQPTAYFGHAVAEVAPCITLYVVKEYHLPSLVH